VLLGLGMAKLSDLYQKKYLRYGIYFLMTAVFATNWVCQMSLNNIAKPYPVEEAFTHNFKENSCAFYQDVKKVFDHANATYGKNAKGLLLDRIPCLYFSEFTAETAMWYHYTVQTKMLRTSVDPAVVLNIIFNEEKYDFIIMPKKGLLPSNPNFKMFYSPEFLAGLQPEYEQAGIVLYKKKDNN
jgi:hypothetical protein